MDVAGFFCLFVCCFFYYYFYFLFTSLLTQRVIQDHIKQVFIYKSTFILWEEKLVLFHFLIFLAVLYIMECLFWFDMYQGHDCFMSTIGSLHFTAAVSCLNLILIPTAYYHMETQNYTCCKCNYTLLFFLHFRGTNHIAGSYLSIGKAGVYSKEQDLKKKMTLNHEKM